MNGHDSTATMLTTFNETTIKNAFTEIMTDEALHVSFFKTALTQAGATPRPKPTFKRLAQANLMDFATMSGMLGEYGSRCLPDGHASDQQQRLHGRCSVNCDD